MKQVLVLMLAVLAGSVCKAAPTDADFYLSPEGSDEWSGTLSNANTQGTDGPFATLERARGAVRDLKRRKSADIVVLVRDGVFQLDKTVVFGLEDSGKGDSTVTYAAYPGETPVFSSGKEIEGWKKVTTALPGLPDAANGNVWMADVSYRFFTLYDSEGLLPRARSEGFVPLGGGSRNQLHFPRGRLKNWPNVEDVEIIVRPHHAWISNVLPLVSVDEEKQRANTSIDATYVMNKLHFLPTVESCWVENALEELDEPGEWVLNTKEGKVYLWPRNKTTVLAPQLTELIRIEGDIDKEGPKDTPARNLCFRGLTFIHGERYQLTADDAGLQHDWDMHDKANALVRLRGTENCVIEQCHFAHSGSGAIRVDLHGQQNRISGNHIEQMGGAGILLCGYGPGTKDVNTDNLVYNNHIHHMGRIYLHSPGIMLWQSGQNRVANNLIHHMPYSGMIVSGFMTHFFERNGRELTRTIRKHEIGDLPRPKLEDARPYLHTHDNLIEYNEIHNVMEKMGDGNGIYIRGAGAGNVIRRNYIHHLVTPMLMQAAIRTDGGQRDTTIAENLIFKCMAQGIILKLNNRCENNIVADILAPPRGYYLSLREGPLTDAVIKRNIFYSAGKDTVFIDELLPSNGRKTEDRRGRALARAKDADTDYNIYYCATNPALGEKKLEEQQRDGVDANSRAVDPMFVDPENGDFRFKPGSPTLEMGIVPFDISKVGLRSESTPKPEAKVVQLRPDDVTAIIASSGSHSGNAKRHFRSANVVHGFDSPQDSVTWTVSAPKEDDYVVSVLFSKREQVKLEVSLGDSLLTAPSMIKTWENRPFFWRQELPGKLHLKAGENKITFRLPEAKAAGGNPERSVRFGQGVTEDFHLFSIELGTTAARQAQVERAKAIRGDASWMIDGKYGIFVHWSSQSRGFNIDEKRAEWFQKSVEMFDVKVFADAIQRTGAAWITFTATHQGFYWPGPNAAIDKVAPGRTSKRDLLGEIIDELDQRGIRTLFYLHTGYNGYDPEVWREALGAKDADTRRFSDNVEAILRECSLRYGEKLMGFGYMDGALAWDYPLRPSWEGWARAIKAGNPKAVVGFSSNRGPTVGPFSELAVTDGGSELLEIDPQLIGPGKQLGDVTTAWWCLMDQGGWFQNRPMNGRYSGGPVHSTQEYVDFFKHMAEAKIPVTINLIMTADVTDEHPIFNPKCMAVMEEVRKAVRGR